MFRSSFSVAGRRFRRRALQASGLSPSIASTGRPNGCGGWQRPPSVPGRRHPETTTTTMPQRAVSSSPPKTTTVRLSKRMGELDLFSRREADRLILEGRVSVDGTVVEVGHKVPADLEAHRIEVRKERPPVRPFVRVAGTERWGTTEGAAAATTTTTTFTANTKPSPSFSTNPEDTSRDKPNGNPPAIRLLTPYNRVWEHRGEHSHAEEPGGDRGARRRRRYDWRGFAPAGRLDKDSRGLLVFTNHGVLAKKLIGRDSTVDKEYVATVEPAARATLRERGLDPAFVPPPPRRDLAPLLAGGATLLGDPRPLEACVEAAWVVEGETLRFVLREGRKHQIRRMCRELLGFHVVDLRRVRIGPVRLVEAGRGKDLLLPEGSWRSLRPTELEELLPNNRRQ